MSYTAPNNIQTKADAIIALASTLADEDLSARGDGTVNTALDVLADQLAGSDVDVPPTNAGAILELAQYVSQGGGGAETYAVTQSERVEHGTLTAKLGVYDPTADNIVPTGDAINRAAAGSWVVVEATPDSGYEAMDNSFDFLTAADGVELSMYNIGDYRVFIMPAEAVYTYAEFDAM